jgi:hypothetical protein
MHCTVKLGPVSLFPMNLNRGNTAMNATNSNERLGILGLLARIIVLLLLFTVSFRLNWPRRRYKYSDIKIMLYRWWSWVQFKYGSSPSTERAISCFIKILVLAFSIHFPFKSLAPPKNPRIRADCHQFTTFV